MHQGNGAADREFSPARQRLFCFLTAVKEKRKGSKKNAQGRAFCRREEKLTGGTHALRLFGLEMAAKWI